MAESRTGARSLDHRSPDPQVASLFPPLERSMAIPTDEGKIGNPHNRPSFKFGKLRRGGRKDRYRSAFQGTEHLLHSKQKTCWVQDLGKGAGSQ
jgi:hypothetical protein